MHPSNTWETTAKGPIIFTKSSRKPGMPGTGETWSSYGGDMNAAIKQNNAPRRIGNGLATERAPARRNWSASFWNKAGGDKRVPKNAMAQKVHVVQGGLEIPDQHLLMPRLHAQMAV